MTSKRKYKEQIIAEVLNLQTNIRILDNISDLLWVKDNSGRYALVSQSFARRYGITVDAIIGKTDYEFKPFHVAAECARNDYEVLTTLEGRTFLETEITPVGREILYESCINPFFSLTGEIMGTLGVSRNITARRQMEVKLRSSEDKFAKAIHLSMDVMMLLNYDDFVILEINHGFSRLTGYFKEEALGKTTQQLELFPDLADKTLKESLANCGELVNLEAECRGKSGVKLRILISAQVIIINGEKNILFSGRNISERKKSGSGALDLL